MIKLAVIVAIVFAVAYANCAPLNGLGDDVKEGMRSAFANGLSKFGSAIKAETEAVVPAPSASQARVYSQYTKNIKSLGGGKPALVEQYRQHNFLPIAPVVVPSEHNVRNPEKLSPEEAAEVFVPHAPLQFTTDRLRPNRK